MNEFFLFWHYHEIIFNFLRKKPTIKLKNPRIIECSIFRTKNAKKNFRNFHHIYQ